MVTVEKQERDVMEDSTEQYYENNKLPFPFSLSEMRDRGTAISGMPKSGKTNLGKILADYLMKQSPFFLHNKQYDGFIVKVFDPSQEWLRSSVPYYTVINSFGNYNEYYDVEVKILNPLNESIVFDISRLLPEERHIPIFL